MNNIYGVLVSFIYIGVIIGLAKLFQKISTEASRKFIHIMLSNWWFIAMAFFDNMWWAALVPLIFVVINYLSYRFDLIKVMEREDGEKDGLGTVYYALSLLILSLITFGPLKNPAVGLVGVTVMGYGDGFAAIVGKSIKSPIFHWNGNKKTLAGSITMLVITLCIVSGFLAYMQIGNWLLKAVIISIIATLIEAISIKGTDNITIPLMVSGMAFLVL